MDNKEILEMLSSILTELKDVKGGLQQARLEISEKNGLINQMKKEIIGLHASIAVLSGQHVDGQTQSYIDAQNIQAINTMEAEARFSRESPFKNR